VLIDPVSLAVAGGALFYLAVIIVSSIRDGRWYKEQQRRMQADRPSLPDAAFLGSVAISEGEGPLWLAVRRAVAESVGLPYEAIYPENRLADLWRMQCIGLGPDLLDLIFRLERILGFKINRRSIDASFALWYGQQGEFREFAASCVRAIASAAHDPPPPRL
jgi:hypothetical protein